MIENLQDELSQLENKQTKSVKLRANTLDGGQTAKNAPKLSKYRICKIKQYLNHIY